VAVEKVAFLEKLPDLGIENVQVTRENRLWRILTRFYFGEFSREGVFQQPQ
jgi:hypothetical protein